MTDEAGAPDPAFDALQLRNDETRHLDEPTFAEDMATLLRAQTALACDEMTPEHRRMLAREVLRLQLKLSVREAA